MTDCTTDQGLDVRLRPEDLRTALRADVRAGLSADPKRLPPKYFYDARGSALFEEITQLPEYYPSRTEEAILRQRAAEIAELSAAETLVELGSGSSRKTRLLLDALTAGGTLRRYVPVDVSPAALSEAMAALSAEYADLQLCGVVADLEHQLDGLPGRGRQLVAFLGGTIGNLEAPQRHSFLRTLRSRLGPRDRLLVGADMVKATDRLVAAYDDAAGITAQFNRNVLHVLNRELGATFEPDEFDHVARWNAAEEQIEMWLRARYDMRVALPDLDMQVAFARGEQLRTEVSAKFRPERLRAELADAGLTEIATWTDRLGDYALTLVRPA